MNQIYSEIENNVYPVDIQQIPLLSYDDFAGVVKKLLKEEENHCLNYFTIEKAGNLIFYCFIANDTERNIKIFSHRMSRNNTSLQSLTPYCPGLHIFEREIRESYGCEISRAIPG